VIIILTCLEIVYDMVGKVSRMLICLCFIPWSERLEAYPSLALRALLSGEQCRLIEVRVVAEMVTTIKWCA